MLSITKKEDMVRKVISIRNLKSFNFDVFVAHMDLDEITGDNLDDMVEAFENKRSMSLDILAQVTTKQITIHTSNPWYTEDLREQKKKVRGREKIWHKYRKQCQWHALTNEKEKIQHNVE